MNEAADLQHDTLPEGTGDEFRRLLEGLRSGSSEAVESLLNQYGHHIVRAVRRRLNQDLRKRFDSQDFVQAVWASFFAHSSRIADFDTPEEMIAFLSTVAGNKVTDEFRRNVTAQKRTVNREQTLDGDSPSTVHQLTDRTPSPSEVFIAHEQFNQLMDGQPSQYRQMIELRATGATFQQIADELKVSERNVRRIIQRLSRRVR